MRVRLAYAMTKLNKMQKIVKLEQLHWKSLVTVTKYLIPLTKSFGKYLTTNVFCVPYQIIWLQLFGTIYQRVW